MYDIMKRLLTCILFAYILCTAALAKRVEGRVHYSSRVLPGVIVTDGEVFTRTDGEGYFRMEVRSDTRFIQVISPYGFTAPLADAYPQSWQEAEGRTWFDFELLPTSPATDFTLFAMTLPQIADEEQLAAFESTFIPDLSDMAISARIKGLTVAVARTDSIGTSYLPKVKKLLAKAKIPFYLSGDGPSEKAFYVGKDLVICSRDGGPGSDVFVQNLLAMLQEDTYVFYPESFRNKWENAPAGYKVYSRSGGNLARKYHSVNAAAYPDDFRAQLVLSGKSADGFEKEAFAAICSGVRHLATGLQMTKDGKVIILQDNYPKFAAAGKMEAGDFIDRTDAFAKEQGYPAVHFTFAINSGSGAGEGRNWPEYREFAEKCMELLLGKNLGDRLTVASLDDRLLNYIHKNWPQIELCYLVDTECGGYNDYMSLLDFVPQWLGVQQEMLDDALAGAAREAGMRITVWRE